MRIFSVSPCGSRSSSSCPHRVRLLARPFFDARRTRAQIVSGGENWNTGRRRAGYSVSRTADTSPGADTVFACPTVEHLWRELYSRERSPGDHQKPAPAGNALVIHAAADDNKTDPSGNAGARIRVTSRCNAHHAAGSPLSAIARPDTARLSHPTSSTRRIALRSLLSRVLRLEG